GRLHPAGAEPAGRAGIRTGGRLHRRDRAPGRPRRLRSPAPDGTAGRDARRCGGTCARGGGRHGADRDAHRGSRRARGGCDRRRGAARRERTAARRAGARARALPDRERAPALRPPAHEPAARRASRAPGPLGLQPGRPHGRPRGVPHRRVVGSPRARGAAREGARRPDRRRGHRAARQGGARLVARQPRAERDDRRTARQRGTPARSADVEAQRGPRRRLDRNGLAGDDGRRDPQWPRRRARPLTSASGSRGVTVAPERIETRLDGAIDAATNRLLELQHPSGWWVGELESNATMIAQHLFWHHVLNLRSPELDRKIANELLARQREDGTWSIWFDGPPDLSTSVEAYAALKLAGVDPGPKARDYIRSQGGVPRTRIFTKCFLALLGQWPWNRIVPIPVELILLPANAYVSIYNFSCWARGTFVPLSVCRTLRPVRGADLDLREIGAQPGRSSRP